MENASKALIIAGAILVAIMIVSLGVYIFNKFGGAAKENATTRMNEQEIGSFNSRITPYLGQNVPGSQVNALIQYVISNDLACVKSGEINKAIKITFPSGSIEVKNGEVDGINGTKRVDTSSGSYYEVRGNYDTNGLITDISVSKK